MAQPIVRKKPAGLAANAPIVLSDGSNGDINDDRRDSQWLPAPVEADKPTNAIPSSCFGHFDRLDIEYTPKTKTRARVVVYHDSPIASWSKTPDLTGAGMSTHDFAAKGGVDDPVERTTGKKRKAEAIISWLDDAHASFEGEAVSAERRRRVTRSTVQAENAGSLLKSLEVSRSAERTTAAEDPYFAGRLAATSVILLRDGLMHEAKKLGQWSVDLVGKHEWDKMIDIHVSAPRDENDGGEWIALLLGEAEIHLQDISPGKAMELRELVVELQRKGILPQKETRAGAC